MIEPRSLSVEGVPPLKTIREILSMSQQEFASWLGLAVSTVSRWERGIGTPVFTSAQFKKLVGALEPHGYTLKDLPDDLGSLTGST